MPDGRRRLRADAERNRRRIVDTAYAAFAGEGLSVSVHEIARRAGVGTGTVSRHFPTKDDLFQAVFTSRVERLAALGRDLSGGGDPAEAFFAFFAEVVAEGTANRGIAEALAGTGFDLGAVAAGDRDPMRRMADLLERAQRAGAVRQDVEVADVKALITGCLAADPPARERMVSIARSGLAANRDTRPV